MGGPPLSWPGNVTFGWEPVRTIYAEPNFRDLLQEHWEGLAVHKDEMPLDPDFDRFAQLEDMGIFKVWAARSANGMLVGYFGLFIQPHIHYKTTLTAVEDLYLLSAPYRRGMTGFRFFKTAIAALKELGVKRVILHDKVHFAADRGTLGRFFERLGFEHTDRLWSRML